MLKRSQLDFIFSRQIDQGCTMLTVTLSIVILMLTVEWSPLAVSNNRLSSFSAVTRRTPAWKNSGSFDSVVSPQFESAGLQRNCLHPDALARAHHHDICPNPWPSHRLLTLSRKAPLNVTSTQRSKPRELSFEISFQFVHWQALDSKFETNIDTRENTVSPFSCSR